MEYLYLQCPICKALRTALETDVLDETDKLSENGKTLVKHCHHRMRSLTKDQYDNELTLEGRKEL